MHPNLLQLELFRALDWRFQRARELARPHAQPARRVDDHYVRVVRHILVELEDAHGDPQQMGVARDAPEAFQAYQMYVAPQHQEPRETLKAWLLAGESDEAIASRMGLQPKVVEYFEKCFFHVRDRLEHRDWIQLTALKPPARNSSTPSNSHTDRQRWWVYQSFAYRGGPLVLEMVLRDFTAFDPAEATTRVAARFDGPLSERIRACGILMAMGAPLDRKNAQAFIKLALRWQRS